MRLYATWPSWGRLCLEKMIIMTRFVVAWCIFLRFSPIFLKRGAPSSPAPLPGSMSASPEASCVDAPSPWYSQYFSRAVTLKTFQEDLELLGEVTKLPRKRCSSWHDVLCWSQPCFLEWYKSTVARFEPEKAGSLIRSSASWTSSLVETDDMSNVTVHRSPTWWQPKKNKGEHLISHSHTTLCSQQSEWLRANQIPGQMSKHWSGRVNRTGCVLNPPAQGRLRANIHTLSHKTEKAFKVE